MTSSRWSDLDRPPLNAAALRRAVVTADSLWTALDVVQATGSTNSDLAARAAAGAAEGAVLVAEEQTAGRGRLDRRWTAPARSGLFFSVLLRPGEPAPAAASRGAADPVDPAGPVREPVPVHRWGWLPLLAGVATATALSRAAGVDTALKWPNDLLVTVDGEERKAGGILAERTGAAGVVIGIGINVSLRAAELPVPTAASLALAGAQGTDRDPLLRAVLRSLADWYDAWRAADGDPAASRLQQTYAAGCATLGRQVRAELPGGRELAGTAVAVDGDGRLVIAGPDGERPVGAGDVVHLRPSR
ncbi:biotin--[acetyl-CoA-carboxylase] ligase [Streptomyces sp. NBC_01477]|uniref:biotin--[acetyl-CoA-carboxylase] ligase n=1 Tax=Streptomyces sp. NBC_01477 TaxID=2976015 RepID=UPI002E330C3A|nr:biotin--[acetyl-CoA-carboxylase] ligase [Streptomyces sp. NBC_01477]